MKKQKLLLPLTIALYGVMFMLIAVSCQKTWERIDNLPAKLIGVQPNLPPVKGNADLAVEQYNGWLKFPSHEMFHRTMEELHKNFAAKELGRWESHFGGYTSLRTMYERIDADDSDDRTAPTVDSLIRANLLLDCPDSWFATVLSNEGRIQIADTLYQFLPGQENGEAYAIPERYINTVVAGEDVRQLDGVAVHYTSFKRHPFIRFEDGSRYVTEGPNTGLVGICNYPNTPMFNWWGQMGGDIYSDDNGYALPQHNGRNVKLNYHRWRVGYIFYASAGVRLKMWKHTRFAGWLSNINWNSAVMEACTKGVTLHHNLPPIPFSATTSPMWPGLSVGGTNAFERTLKWVADPVFCEIGLLHFNFHFKVDYQGRSIERYIRQ